MRVGVGGPPPQQRLTPGAGDNLLALAQSILGRRPPSLPQHYTKALSALIGAGRRCLRVYLVQARFRALLSCIRLHCATVGMCSKCVQCRASSALLGFALCQKFILYIVLYCDPLPVFGDGALT